MRHVANHIKRYTLAATPHQHIFLMSHMRAYSSLFGHIMGSHPQICGYYEMHIGYYSWKSLVRQKLLYFRDETAKPGFKSMFDKVLHNDHEVLPTILHNHRTRFLISLRPPEQTIPSIRRLYQRIDPAHDYNDAGFATDYYIDRLQELERLARTMPQKFLYFDAELLMTNAQDTLQSISHWLELHPGLSTEYQLQKKTSETRVGDSSENLAKGKIAVSRTDSEQVPLSSDLVARARPVYEAARQSIISASQVHCS